MKSLDALTILNDLSSSQKGMFTAAQAKAAGVDRLSLSRLAHYGQIERIAHGVYRSSAAPSFREDRVYAAWLWLDPSVMAYERPRNATDCVASLATAAWLQDLGELNPEPITFTCPARKQTKRSDIKLAKGKLSDAEVTVISGIPVTTPVRTVIDLLDEGEDLSLVSGVLRDAAARNESIETADFASRVDERAKHYGFASGFTLYDYLRKG